MVKEMLERKDIMNNIVLTIFTPTYNRGNLLSYVYESLKKQSVKNFEWLIVDDGSTDNTSEVVQAFLAEKAFPIRYIKKKNEGKHIAINCAAKEAKGEWFFIVDSDDYILDNAVERIMYYLNEVKDNSNFAGVVGLRGDGEKNPWTVGRLKDINEKRLKQNRGLNKKYIDATSIEYRYKYHIDGDRAEVVRTELISQYPFPKFEGEKFLPESYLWLTLSIKGYKFRWFNEVIYITEYMDDGLTRNGKKLAMENWKSRCFLDDLTASCKGVTFKQRLKNTVNYYRYGMYGGRKINDLYKNSHNKALSIIAIPGAVVMRLSR